MKKADVKTIHFIGIKGTGMSGLALLLAYHGYKVTGSDAKDSFLLIKKSHFTKAGVKIYPDFDTHNISKKTDLIVLQPSHNSILNPEVKEAKKRKIPIRTYAQMVAHMTKESPTIAVTGTHGKTTTTNLLAHVLLAGGQAITALGGPTSGQVLTAMSKVSKPERFVLEADEYQNKLARYKPRGVILTNIELDHPDYFTSKKQYVKMFADFVKRIPKDGFLIYCADDANVRSVAKLAKCQTYAYGTSKHATFKVSMPDPHTFDITVLRDAVHLTTPLLGLHNALNTTAVVIAASIFGIPTYQVQKALSKFKGSDRRLELVRSAGPMIYDDYGHHPTEIKATLEALRSAYPKKKIWTVFQGHTFTRTAKFLKEFGASFGDSDHTVVLDIWGSSREKHGGVHARDLVREINQHKRQSLPRTKRSRATKSQGNAGDRFSAGAYYHGTRKQAAEFLNKKVKKSDLILTIGASDIYKIHRLLK